MPLNTQCSEYNGSFTQFIDVSSNLITLNLSDIDPKEDSKIPLTQILKLQFYVRMMVVFQELFAVQLSVEYQPPTLIEKFMALSQGNGQYLINCYIRNNWPVIFKRGNGKQIQDIESEKTN